MTIIFLKLLQATKLMLVLKYLCTSKQEKQYVVCCVLCYVCACACVCACVRACVCVCVCRQGDTIDAFHLCLQQLAITYEFDDKEAEIKSQIIHGCLSKALCEAIFSKELLDRARASELSVAFPRIYYMIIIWNHNCSISCVIRTVQFIYLIEMIL